MITWRARGPPTLRVVVRHGVGDVVDGYVIKVLPFGAFIRVAGAFDGLLIGEDRPDLGPMSR